MSARILITDDDAISCHLFAKVLQGEGYQVDWVQSGEEALTRLGEQAYDSLLIDVRLPGILGTEFAEGIKKENPDAKILSISAFADNALRKTADRLGVTLLSKPFTPARLLAVMSEILNQPT
jgi:CheY-like chemotaxis protein